MWLFRRTVINEKWLLKKSLLAIPNYLLFNSIHNWLMDRKTLISWHYNSFAWSTSFQNQELSGVLNWNLVLGNGVRTLYSWYPQFLWKIQYFAQIIEYLLSRLTLRLLSSKILVWGFLFILFGTCIIFEWFGGVFSSFGYWNFYVTPRFWITETQFAVLLTLRLNTEKIMVSITNSASESLYGAQW